MTPAEMMRHRVTPAMRARAARQAHANGLRLPSLTGARPHALTPGAPPDYFGPYPNYANSPLPVVNPTTHTVEPGTGIRKFVDSLPGLGYANRNDLDNYIPVATPDTTTYPGSDYYVIALQRYTQQLHRDLPATQLQGYVQLNNGTDKHHNNTIVPPARPYYMGPAIVAQSNRPVRVLFKNELPTGDGGNLFIPVDTSIMGAGADPGGGMYTQNRATIHLHGGFTPWISDGTPFQWITPPGEHTSYPKGVSVRNVPDMPDPGAGAQTFFYTNQQGARLMFYHDHSIGTTRLNVYAGEAAPYILQDPTEKKLVTDGVIPSEQVPLVIQDKTFVPDDTQLGAEDPTWDKAKWGGRGNFWWPHVYMPAQDPATVDGAAPMGRWDYGPFVTPPFTGVTNGPIPNPYYDPVGAPWENATVPGTPTPSSVPEAFMDTPLVNGTAYPYLSVTPKAYRFRILNASSDRTLNLQLYYAKSNGPMWNPDGTLNDGNAGEVPMVAAASTPGYPPTWPTDGRAGGVPDPAARGPEMIQIGNEGGFLPAPAVLPNQPIDYQTRNNGVVANMGARTLLLGPAERADVIVDFSQVPAGSKLILYSDAPAPAPTQDPRYDYYTGDPDQTSTGGAPTTLPGYGPDTRTIMQFDVQGTPAPAFGRATLQAQLPVAYSKDQPTPIVPEKAYDAAFGTTTPDNTYSGLLDTTLNWAGLLHPLTMYPKSINEGFENGYGRLDAVLGTELNGDSLVNRTGVPMAYVDPPTEIIKPSQVGTQVGSLNDGTQIWKVTHNGVDSHAIHFHLFDVELINRVGVDGVITPPEPAELGWKETVMMNPQEDAIVALRPMVPKLPFKVPDSIRPLNPDMPVTTANHLYDFGWEYVWHCHLLGHEENDMMRPMVFQASPNAPTNLWARVTGVPAKVSLYWTNNATYPAAHNMLIQRADDAAFTTGVTNVSVNGTAVSHGGSSVAGGATYYYRVRAETTAAYSAWSNVLTVVALTTPPPPATLTATAYATGAGPANIDATWTETTGPTITGFEIQRATNSAYTANFASFTLPASARTDTLTGLGRNTRYYVRVRALNGSTASTFKSVNLYTPR